MPESWFPTVEEVVTFHYLIGRRPSRHDPDDRGVRDRGVIEAAIARANGTWFNHGGDLPERAAFLLRGICQDHAFLNANKRTAFVTAAVFLRLNGLHLHASSKDVIKFMLAVAQNKVSVDEIRIWLQARLFAVKPFHWNDLWALRKLARRRAFSWRFRRDILEFLRVMERLDSTEARPTTFKPSES